MTLKEDLNEGLYEAYCTFKGSREFIAADKFYAINDAISTARTYSWGGRDVVGVFIKENVAEETISTIMAVAEELGLTEIECERRYHYDTESPEVVYFTREADYDHVLSSAEVRGGA